MNIHEYQAKNILSKYSIPIPCGVVILNKDEINNAIDKLDANIFVIKSQVHAGGRGKAGGIKMVKTKEEAKIIAKKMLGMTLVTEQTGHYGQLVRKIYVETGVDIKKEYYFGIVVDSNTSMITLIASTEGGVEIEEIAKNKPEKIITLAIDQATSIQNYHLVKIAYGLGLKGNLAKEMMQIIKNCYQLFIDTDASQIEFNPLVITNDNKLLILDAKINFDDNALVKHQAIMNLRDDDGEDPLEREAKENQLNYIRMDGNIGCMVNGAGLAMATMDIIKLYGGTPANFLDVGGGTTEGRVTKAFNIILADPKVSGILVNIFGGIVKCDMVAEGIINATKKNKITIPIVVRLAGTNYELGIKMLNNSGLNIITANDLADAAEKIVRASK